MAQMLQYVQTIGKERRSAVGSCLSVTAGFIMVSVMLTVRGRNRNKYEIFYTAANDA